MKKVLIVDDNADNRTLCRIILENNYEVIEAPDGETALNLAQTNPPHLILLDLSLPSIDGWEVVRQIRSDEQMNSIRIIALTAHAMEGNREKAINAGFDDYISKPISMKKLLDIVNKHASED